MLASAMMVAMITPTGMDDLLRRLYLLATARRPSGELTGLEAVRSWTVAELLLADERSRAGIWWWQSGEVPDIARAMNRGGRLATWLTSLGRDGYTRERAVRGLASDPDLSADRLIAVRVSDPVEQVRDQAWSALQLRRNPEQAAVVVPVLVRLSARVRAASAMERYAGTFYDREAQPLWSVLLGHPDRETRRWAFGAAIGAGAIEPELAVDLLPGEADQWVVARLAAMIAAGDPRVGARLLDSRHAAARALVIGSLPDAQLGEASIEAGLFDRSAKVRAAARYRASTRGVPAETLYLRAWRERRDVRALIGAAECGVRFELADLREYLVDAEPRVRSVAAQSLAGQVLTGDDVRLLFALLDDPFPRPAKRATQTLAKAGHLWPYEQAAALWEAADPVKRGRLWRLLSGRGGWDRVRADLLAASDPDVHVQSLGRSDLDAWLQSAAMRMWRSPSSTQIEDIQRALPIAKIERATREAIEFRADLPVAPRSDMERGRGTLTSSP